MTTRERGTVTAFVSVLMVALLVVAGLVFDGGHLLAARRDAANIAESAARAGAQALDETAVRSGAGVVLDPLVARRRSEDYLAVNGFDGQVAATREMVAVEVTVTRQLFILGVAGLNDVTVTGRGQARAVRGVLQEGD